MNQSRWPLARGLSSGVVTLVAVLAFCMLFVLLYFEDRVFLFGASLSNIWKLALILLLLAFSVLSNNAKMPRFFLLSILTAASFALNANLSFSLKDLENIILFLILPVAYYGSLYLLGRSITALNRVLIFLSASLLLSAIPFILGVLNAPNPNEEILEAFARSYNLQGSMLIGFFKHPAISSKVFMVCTAIVFSIGVMDKRGSSLYRLGCFAVFLLGLYCVYASFTRTGWLMLIVFFGWYLVATSEISKRLKIVSVLIFALSIFTLTIVSEAFSNRLFATGLRETVNQGSTLSILSNGRADIYAAILALIFSGEGISILIGIGSEMFHALNYGGSAHNVFLEIFVEGGLVSLFLYLLWILLLYREIVMNGGRAPELVGLLLAMLVSLGLSHGLSFFGNLLFGMLLAHRRVREH